MTGTLCRAALCCAALCCTDCIVCVGYCIPKSLTDFAKSKRGQEIALLRNTGWFLRLFRSLLVAFAMIFTNPMGYDYLRAKVVPRCKVACGPESKNKEAFVEDTPDLTRAINVMGIHARQCQWIPVTFTHIRVPHYTVVKHSPLKRSLC